MIINTDGLVIGERIVGESDRLVTLLTREEGILRAFAPKAKKLKDSKISSTQLLSYSNFVLYKGKEKYVINDGRTIELFFDLRKDIAMLSLAQYFCELASLLAPEGAEAGDFLRLILNALHFLCKQSRSELLLKSVVEMRLLAMAGFMPNLIACDSCGQYESDPMYFVLDKGLLYCKDCVSEIHQQAIAVSPGVLTALRHTIYADFEKLFSFRLPESGLQQLATISERYLIHVVERRIPTLEFYHQIASMGETI